MKNLSHFLHRGVTSLEVIIGVTVAGIVIVYAANAVTLFINSARDINTQMQALYLAEEGLELVRFFRDNDWNGFDGLSLNTTHYIEIASTSIDVSNTPEVIGGFTRSFTLQNVYRNNTTDDIVASTTGGSSADDDSKYVIVLITWGSPSKNLSLQTILTDIDP